MKMRDAIRTGRLVIENLPFQISDFRFQIFRASFLSLALTALCGCQTISRERAAAGVPERAVALTFDDGPNAHANTTARLLDVLKKHRVKAMFCLLGVNAERYPQLARRMDAEGHLIINHGYSDEMALFMDDGEFKANLERGERAISAALGRPLSPRLYRPHGGCYTAGQEEIWRRAGYTLVPATARAYDAVRPPSERDRIMAQILAQLERQRGGIVLLHDAHDSYVWMNYHLAKNPRGAFNRAWIPAATDELIGELRRRGYRLNDFDFIQALK